MTSTTSHSPVCSSISVEGSAEIRKAVEARGAKYIASPVSGNGKCVKAGKLALVTSGPRDVFEEVRVYQEITAGLGVTYVGEGELTETIPPLDRDPAPLQGLVLVPVWVGRFVWHGRTGLIVVNGLDGTVVGDRPVDFGRLRRSALLGTVPAVLLGLCLGLPTLLLAGFGVLIWGAALLAMLVAHRRWARLERTALEQQRW